MDDDTSDDIERLLRKIRDRDPGAVRELIARAHDRLRLLAGKMLNESFPRLTVNHEIDSVIGRVYEPLAKALAKVELLTPEDFFRFAAHKLRQTLLDMVADLKRTPPPLPLGPADSSSGPIIDKADSTLNVDQKAMWEEFHRRVADLPDDVRAVFETCQYLGMTQAEVAAALGQHPRQVSRLWAKAMILLKRYVPQGE